jgi:NAD(P)-dependent dehydrogenase (short-subunit alcohol dehydrogenase family)
MGRLTGRVAIITGAGDGIGHGIARRFAAEGASILVAELNSESGPRVAAEIAGEFGADAVCVRTNVSVKDDVLAMVAAAHDRWGKVDILINNAWGGRAGIGRVEHRSDADMQEGLGVGFYGPFWAMQAVFPGMRENHYGRIVNMASLNGVNAHMGTLHYNCAKEALRALTRSAAREWAAYGITANVICPGAKTAASRRVFAEHPELAAAADAANPMGRMGDPETDIAPAALFLASEDCRYVTGNTLFVDGGTHINGSSWAPDLPDQP